MFSGCDGDARYYATLEPAYSSQIIRCRNGIVRRGSKIRVRAKTSSRGRAAARAAKLADMRGESYEQGIEDIEWYDGVAAEVFSNGAVQIEYTNAHAGTADDIIRPVKPSGSYSRLQPGLADVY